MSTHAEDLARRWVQVFNEEDFDGFDELLSPDYRYHLGEWTIEGVEAAKEGAPRRT